MNSSTAQRTWEILNGVENVDASDFRYKFDGAKVAAMRKKEPWKTDPNYFKEVHISAVALIKMVMHAKSGLPMEVMGGLLGKFEEHAFIVMDAFPLPVDGTEVRVEALEEGSSYQVNYLQAGQQVKRSENCIGWYHSHPGYGCWLSSIDVETQRIHQRYEDPWLAIVVDPVRTMASGKVDVGAFRTYNEGYQPRGGAPGDHQIVPLKKKFDYDKQHRCYYRLDVTCFKSSLDVVLLEAVWNRFWAKTLSTSPMLENREHITNQIADLGAKINLYTFVQNDTSWEAGYTLPHKYEQVVRKVSVSTEALKVASEQARGLMTLIAKQTLFNS
mmetsp:Transcript_10976/g.33669  ORF Transcript_10976/g.33669 Transcript_10976/m.33669 type:complete len:329 (+) Transcript_10976:95-1081(+)|eukprot:CAMPEP_0198736048 /NCGR_PEP_ID=MMETSP1475-20131203/63221_1 /TAXON_ID= ORGANISM="Unidentified sp., Strain CCMP1999" /NCGR_SAMPLE_ID=MMETSP1475 /ASSEMBLY_ACC=CAM_ASM_001111 /LENGTH=328 /DNA_ID=CAMNT_0044499797 /DNA_START=46 /DNA_END=1032 /DNA_ORIENTATION=-